MRSARFSALQRAEIAEIRVPAPTAVSLLRFSALQRAEIAEILEWDRGLVVLSSPFQCSSTSRNC